LILQQIVNGLTIGSAYGLVAIGYGLIFSVLKLINFAHGEVYMLGAFIAFTSISILSKSFIFAILAVIFGTASLGYLMATLVYLPMKGSPKISLIVASLALSMIMRNTAMFFWGTRTLAFPSIFPLTSFRIGDLRITYLQSGLLVVSFLLVSIFHLIIFKTKLGKAIRAVSLNYMMASVLGINPNYIITLVFLFGGALGGIAGVFVSSFYGSLSFDMGIAVGNRAFIACILGGMGSIFGAMFGGIIIGIAETLAIAYIAPDYKDAVAFIILILVLFFKPTGLFGGKELMK